jgi:uncharacterized protein (TIGR02246 family)
MTSEFRVKAAAQFSSADGHTTGRISYNILDRTAGPEPITFYPSQFLSSKEQRMKARIAMVCLAVGACLVLGFAMTRTNQAAPEDKPVKADTDKADKSDKADKGDKPNKEEEEAIHKAAAAYNAAYAKGDADAVLATWTRDAEFIDDDGKVYRGHKVLGPLFAKALPSFKGYKITGKLTSIRFVKPDVALVDGEQTFTPPRGESNVSQFTSVWVKTDGKWLIRSARDLTPDSPGETVAGRWMREMDWMVGDWVSEGKESTVHLKITPVLNKAFMTMEYDVKRKQGAGSKVVQLVGWDPLTEQIKSWVFDDQGGYGEALWSRNGNSWSSDSTGVLPEGTIGSAFNVLKYIDDDTFTWQSMRREADGQPLPDVEAKFTRKTKPGIKGGQS